MDRADVETGGCCGRGRRCRSCQGQARKHAQQTVRSYGALTARGTWLESAAGEAAAASSWLR
jgi:hypothetical protein